MLPPGLTRWAEVTVDLDSRWDGSGRLTPVQEEIIELLREHGDLRGKQLKRRLPKEMRDDWQRAVNQLAQRDILLKGSVLEAPRARPRKIRTAELIAGPRQLWNRVMELGRASLQSDVLYYLAQSADPLPAEDAVREATGASDEHIAGLIDEGLIQRTSQTRVIVPVAVADDVPEDLQDVYRELPAAADTLDDAAVADLEAQGLAEELTPIAQFDPDATGGIRTHLSAAQR